MLRPILLCFLVLLGSISYLPGEEEPLNFQQRLLRDWIYQDHGFHYGKCFSNKQGNEIERKMIEKVLQALKDEKPEEFQRRLGELIDANVPGSDPRWLDLYRQCCLARRRLRLETVLDESPAIIYTKHFVLGASFYAYTDDTTDEQYHDYSWNRRPGSALCKMTVKPDGSVQHETLLETKEGVIRDPEVSWDGKKILFSMRKHLEKDDFHLYDYDVETKVVRQLTTGPGFADTEPVYLPNGDILFSSTRCVQLIGCWWTETTNFYTCDRDGRFLRRLTFDQVSTNYPKVTSDGRVIYTRWDYNDRGQIFVQPLFVMNPDGTGQTEFYGNNSYFPTSILHARGVPNSSKVVAIASGHHVYQQGKLILIDRSLGTQEAEGITYVSPLKKAESVRIDPFGQRGELFQYPYPFSETEWLVSYLPEGRKSNYLIPFAIYAMDINGARELLAWDPTISCGQAIPLSARPVPILRPSMTKDESKTGQFYVHNVYEGPGLSGVPKGTIRSLRVVSFEVRIAGVGSNRNKGEAGGAMVSTPIAGDNGSWDVKHVLGTVPIEADGSAFFEVPAQTPIFFQLLDKDENVVQTMRSWSTLQPGEFFACVGCHEPKDNTTINLATSKSLALSKPVQKPVPPFIPPKGILEDAGFSFVRDIQPILDIHCVSCHTGKKNQDGTAAPFSLLGDEVFYVSPPKPKDAGPEWKSPPAPTWTRSLRHFSEAYMNLTNYGKRNDAKYVHWLDVQSGPSMLAPYTAGAFKSPLVQIFRAKPRDKNHQEVKISELELRKLALWIDLLVPFCGDYLEESNWKPADRALYEYHRIKKVKMEAIVEKNRQLKLKVDTGQIPPPPANAFEQFKDGGPEMKQKFIAQWLSNKLPIKEKKKGAKNVYRNLALNTDDTQGDPIAWPHASTNSEFARSDCFAAKNVIDGKKDNRGHGDKFPSWGPNKRTDLWLKIDFGHKVRTNKVVIWLRADFPHDDIWRTATIEFSDGSKESIRLKKTAEPQVFRFKDKTTSFIRLTDLKAPFPLGWCGITEIEVWGQSL